MKSPEKAKVEAILPLSFIQNALLFHSLSANDDQGLIHVKLDLYGSLDHDKLKEAWFELIERHDVFRSSIHWEKIKVPVQVVHKYAAHDWSYIDLRDEEGSSQNEIVNQFIQEDRRSGIEFKKASISRVTIFQLSDDHALLIWSCHHILLDGWSSANIIRELAQFYGAKVDGTHLTLPPIPSTKEYRKDQKQNDMTSAQSFWKSYLNGFEQPVLVSENTIPDAPKEGFERSGFVFSEDGMMALESFAKNSKLTVTSVLQSAWALVLSKLTQNADVAFGNILSVRSPRLKNADLMAGLFTNMLPVRVQLNENETIRTLGTKIQKDQGESKDYAFASLDGIQKWIDWPGSIPLFDNIFVVENFPWKDISASDVKFSNFRSGITSSYPLTVVAKLKEGLKLDFIYDASKLSSEFVSALGQNMKKVLDLIIQKGDVELSSLLNELTSIATNTIANEKVDLSLKRQILEGVDEPSTPLEHSLTQIWKDLFKYDAIGVKENFFEIGGSSLLAVRMFQRIQKELNINASPIMILKYPTISKLANFIVGDTKEHQWKSLVSLNTQGDKNALFCLHAKGGYVFFYNQLASHLDDNQPIYALQPRGLDGNEPLYESIEEMANHYIQEIKSVQAKGPYNILATCFSNIVGLEMAQQLLNEREEVNLLMIDARAGKSLKQILDNEGALKKINYKIKTSTLYTKGKSIFKKIVATDQPVSPENQAALKIEAHLEKIFNKYERKPYDGELILIRSSEFVGLERKDFHLEEWRGLVEEENLKVMTVEGHHETLFVEPEVQNLAEVLKQCLK